MAGVGQAGSAGQAKGLPRGPSTATLWPARRWDLALRRNSPEPCPSASKKSRHQDKAKGKSPPAQVPGALRGRLCHSPALCAVRSRPRRVSGRVTRPLVVFRPRARVSGKLGDPVSAFRGEPPVSKLLEPREALCPGEALAPLLPGLAQMGKSGIGTAAADSLSHVFGAYPGTLPVSGTRSGPVRGHRGSLEFVTRNRGSSQETGGSPPPPCTLTSAPGVGSELRVQEVSRHRHADTHSRVGSLAGARVRGPEADSVRSEDRTRCRCAEPAGPGVQERGTYTARSETSNRERSPVHVCVALIPKAG